MRISYVVPAHNEEAHIQACLSSIYHDAVRAGVDAEIILVNNASNDGTADRARSIPGVRVIDEARKGLVRARQTGYEAASGDIIANIDADNIVPPGWTERVVREFERSRTLVGLSGPVTFYDLPWHVHVQNRLFMLAGWCIHVVAQYVFRRGAMMQGGNFTIRRSALDAIGGYNTDLTFYGEDTDIACRLVPVGRVKFTFGLTMFSSGRRLKHEGTLMTGLVYGVNFFWILFFRQPLTRKHRDIRPR
jgi:glycosyltransferase involved in cell wall biosynthesis